MFAQISHWFASRSRPVRYLVVGFCVPLLWSLLLGGVGSALGAANLESLGHKIIELALIPHLPVILVLTTIAPALPMGAGDDGGFEVMLLSVVSLPSCIFYAAVGWFLAWGTAPARES